MVAPQDSNPNKHPTISEEHVFTILQRYSATTVLSLLKEVSQFVDVNIDWNKFMQKTDTGIKSAREYQILWLHLAYGHPLILDIGSNNDQPLDDDSDLEFELEASPLASTIDATEASNCVKALISGPVNKSRMSNSSSLEYQQVQKQVRPARTSSESLGGNGSRSNNHKKRKVNWAEEDLELIALRKGEAQRGNNFKKKQGGLSNEELEKHLATRRALDMACNVKPSAGSGTGFVGNGQASNKAVKGINLPMGSSSKLCPQKENPPQLTVRADPIEAAAVAAGARIGNSSDKATLFEAVQSKNAVHIRGGILVGKTSTAGISSAFPPNAHLARPATKSTSVRPPVPPISQLPIVTATSTEQITDV